MVCLVVTYTSHKHRERERFWMALRSVSRKSLGLAVGHVRGLQSFSLPELPYDYGALEPVISGEIMQLHHQKHHQTYITNYNKALEQLDQALAKADSSSIVQLQSAIKFNGGGFTLSLSHGMLVVGIHFIH